MTSKKKTFLAIGIAVLLIGVFILLNTYAFWRLKGEQSESNYVVGACLSFEFVETPDPDHEGETIGGFNIPKAWPISDEEGIATTGYTFKIKNNCAEDVNYQVVLESLKTQNENYFDNDYIKLQLDNKGINRYSALDNVDNDTTDNHPENIRETKEVYAGVIPGTDKDTENNIKSEVTHTIRIWVSSDAENDQIGKEFKSRIKVFAGQGVPEPEIALTPEECFTIDTITGAITNYDKDNPICGTKTLVLPPIIDGVVVKSILWNEQISLDENPLIYRPSPDPLQNLTKSDISKIQWEYVDLSKAFGLEVIGDASFYKYAGNRELILPDSLKYIGWGAFENYGNTSAPGLIIPDNVTFIGPEAFHKYNGDDLHIGSSVQTVGGGAFIAYKGEGNSLEIPSSVLSIGNEGFWSFSGSRLILNEGLKILGIDAFARYNGEEFTIPSTIRKIGTYAFIFYNKDGDPDNPKAININMSSADFNSPGIVDKAYDWIRRGNDHYPPALNYLVD